MDNISDGSTDWKCVLLTLSKSVGSWTGDGISILLAGSSRPNAPRVGTSASITFASQRHDHGIWMHANRREAHAIEASHGSPNFVIPRSGEDSIERPWVVDHRG